MGARTGSAVALVLLTAIGAYGVADAADVVPDGWPQVLTLDEPWAEPTPFPTVALPLAPRAAPGSTGGDLDPGAPLPSPEALGALTDQLLADPRIAPGAGVAVVDVATGAVLLDRGAAAPRVPASTVKLLTTTAALSALGPDARLSTRVLAGADVATDAAAAGVATPTIHLVGGGDVLLAAGAGNPGDVVGHAGLADLAADAAAALRERGVAAVRVALDDTAVAGPRTAAGWGPVDLDGGFVAPVAALAVDRGILPGRTARDPDAALSAARTFARALGQAGIRVEGDVARAAAPAGAAELASVRSAPVAELVAHTLRASDNDVAESLARRVAVHRGATPDFAGGTGAVLAELAELGLDVDGVRLDDASGLSELDAVPALVLARLLALVADPQRPGLLPVVAGLPVAGLSGTLEDRFVGEAGGQGGPQPAAGLARAKTGTLLTVVSLAGLVLTEDGRLLAFAVVADSVPGAALTPARAAVDTWVNGLTS